MSCRRPNCVRQLTIDDSSQNNTLPAVAAATIVGSQCSSLVSLSIVAPVMGLEGEGIASLVALTRLTHLEVRSCSARSQTAQHRPAAAMVSAGTYDAQHCNGLYAGDLL